jgi:hypothetical protein
MARKRPIIADAIRNPMVPRKYLVRVREIRMTASVTHMTG